MATVKELNALIKRIKAKTGLTQEQMGDSIRYSRVHFSRLKKSDPTMLFDLLFETFKKQLEHTNNDFMMQDGGLPKYKTKQNVTLAEIDYRLTKIEKILFEQKANYQNSAVYQEAIVRLLKAQIVVAAKQLAGSDKKALQDELDHVNKVIFLKHG